MSSDAATSYDEISYPGQFIPMSHPDRMATMAILHGMKPPDVECCRVLELGCCDGGNLLTMAQTLPQASFVGVDLSARQVAEGRAAVESMGVRNVELRSLDMTELDDAFGLFDYIVCHGVYSWVAPPVRDRILEICKRNLAPSGVAYVSYNTYPGWYQRGMVRAMMLYHTRGITDPIEKVRQARAVVDFAARSASPPDGLHAQYLREEYRKLEKHPDTYLFHEYLETDNHPVYFHEFVAHADSAGLRYLSTAQFWTEEARLPAEFHQVIRQLGTDVVRREQYIDFVLNRTFRTSLLCHAGLTTYEGPTPDAVRLLRLSALGRPENPSLDLGSETHEPFITMFGDKVMVDEPLIKSALLVLYRLWPRSTVFEDLWTATLDGLGQSEASVGVDRTSFATSLLQCHMLLLVNLHTCDPSIATEPGERPRTTALALRDAASGKRVISLRNFTAVLEDIDRLVLALLDGTRDQAALVDHLAGEVEAGRLKLQSDGQPITEPAAVRDALRPTLKQSLQRIADQALLVAESR
jgi:cyclopropane fatty-acyl-phospholipid synthase-like methyltransferase